MDTGKYFAGLMCVVCGWGFYDLRFSSYSWVFLVMGFISLFLLYKLWKIERIDDENNLLKERAKGTKKNLCVLLRDKAGVDQDLYNFVADMDDLLKFARRVNLDKMKDEDNEELVRLVRLSLENLSVSKQNRTDREVDKPKNELEPKMGSRA